MTNDWEEWREFAMTHLDAGTKYRSRGRSWATDLFDLKRGVARFDPEAMRVEQALKLFVITQRLKS